MNRPNFIKKRLAEGRTFPVPTTLPLIISFSSPTEGIKPSFIAGRSMSQHHWHEVDCDLYTRQTRGEPGWPSSDIYPTTWVPRLRSVMMREDGASSNTTRMCTGAKTSSNTPRMCIEAKAYAKFKRETTRVSRQARRGSNRAPDNNFKSRDFDMNFYMWLLF